MKLLTAILLSLLFVVPANATHSNFRQRVQQNQAHRQNNRQVAAVIVVDNHNHHRNQVQQLRTYNYSNVQQLNQNHCNTQQLNQGYYTAPVVERIIVVH
jgi:hypothetical protein